MNMNSVRKGLRNGDLEKDTYGRLICVPCEQSLATQDNPSEIGSLRVCPSCEEEWRELR